MRSLSTQISMMQQRTFSSTHLKHLFRTTRATAKPAFTLQRCRPIVIEGNDGLNANSRSQSLRRFRKHLPKTDLTLTGHFSRGGRDQQSYSIEYDA